MITARLTAGLTLTRPAGGDGPTRPRGCRMDSEPFGGRAIGAGIGRAGIPAPDRFGRVRVPAERRAASRALRSDDTDALSGVSAEHGRQPLAVERPPAKSAYPSGRFVSRVDGRRGCLATPSPPSPSEPDWIR